MTEKTLMDPEIKKSLVQDLEKRTKLEAEINEHIDDFMNHVSSATIYSIINLILNQGHPQQKKHMTQVKERYENEGLLLDDTLFLLDMFEKNYAELFEVDD